MNINIFGQLPKNISTATRPPPSQPQPQNSGPNNQGDSATLSATGDLLARLARKIDNSSAVDESRILSIKDRITSGNYAVNFASVAEKLIRYELSLS